VTGKKEGKGRNIASKMVGDFFKSFSKNLHPLVEYAPHKMQY